MAMLTRAVMTDFLYMVFTGILVTILKVLRMFSISALG
jgi:hypothetical protein